MRYRGSGPDKQRGAVAIITGLAMVVLVGFAGLALDGGRLYLTQDRVAECRRCLCFGGRL